MAPELVFAQNSPESMTAGSSVGLAVYTYCHRPLEEEGKGTGQPNIWNKFTPVVLALPVTKIDKSQNPLL